MKDSIMPAPLQYRPICSNSNSQNTKPNLHVLLRDIAITLLIGNSSTITINGRNKAKQTNFTFHNSHLKTLESAIGL